MMNDITCELQYSPLIFLAAEIPSKACKSAGSKTEMLTKESNERLERIFSGVGRKYGFDTVKAEYVVLKDFKIRWQRSYRWVDFRVSDYIEDAPDAVIEAVADSLFERIVGKGSGMSQKFIDWVTDPEFSHRKQGLYLERSSNLTGTVAGNHKNLRDAYDRLIGAGLVPYDPDIAFSWTKYPVTRKAAKCSVLMKVVYVSNVLDSDDVPDYVLDYCVYHELCHLFLGYDPFGVVHNDNFAALDQKFPTRVEAQVWLRRLCTYV